MKTRTKVLIGLFGFFTLFMMLLVIFGSDGKNDDFQPQEEFRLTPWIEIDLFGIDMTINRAVFYLFLAAALTCFTMLWIARRSPQRPFTRVWNDVAVRPSSRWADWASGTR